MNNNYLNVYGITKADQALLGFWERLSLVGLISTILTVFMALVLGSVR